MRGRSLILRLGATRSLRLPRRARLRLLLGGGGRTAEVVAVVRLRLTLRRGAIVEVVARRVTGAPPDLSLSGEAPDALVRRSSRFQFRQRLGERGGARDPFDDFEMKLARFALADLNRLALRDFDERHIALTETRLGFVEEALSERQMRAGRSAQLMRFRAAKKLRRVDQERKAAPVVRAFWRWRNGSLIERMRLPVALAFVDRPAMPRRSVFGVRGDGLIEEWNLARLVVLARGRHRVRPAGEYLKHNGRIGAGFLREMGMFKIAFPFSREYVRRS